MPLSAEKKREVGEALLRGEDVTLETDPMDEHPHQDVQIPIQAIVGRLARRIGELEADLAMARAHAEAATGELQQARMALLEAQLRDTTRKEHADG